MHNGAVSGDFFLHMFLNKLHKGTVSEDFITQVCHKLPLLVPLQKGPKIISNFVEFLQTYSTLKKTSWCLDTGESQLACLPDIRESFFSITDNLKTLATAFKAKHSKQCQIVIQTDNYIRYVLGLKHFHYISVQYRGESNFNLNSSAKIDQI